MAKPSSNPVLATLEKSIPDTFYGPTLLAVSGGPDSVVLLHALHRMSLPDLQLHVAHYNHKLRGDDSNADAEYGKQLCCKLAIPFHLGLAQPGELTPGQSHLESQARKLRYHWLVQLAKDLNCRWVLTGHTMNDQAETVLHHLIRGTGWRGLRGIAPVKYLPSTNKKIRLLRPLLRCSRKDILDYTTGNNLTPRHDTTNDDPRFTRNKIRHQLLPLLIQTKPDAIHHLASWAEIARRHYALVRRTASSKFRKLKKHQASLQLALDRKALDAINDEVLQELLRQAWQSQCWPLDQMSAKRWKETIEVCRGTRTAVELPGRIMVKPKPLVIQFIKQ